MNAPDKSEATIIYYEYGILLRLEQDENLIFNALCGRVGEYGVEFVLNLAERERYKQDGGAFLKELANTVRANPKSYAARGRFC